MGYDIILWDVDGTLMDFKAAENRLSADVCRNLALNLRMR